MISIDVRDIRKNYNTHPLIAQIAEIILNGLHDFIHVDAKRSEITALKPHFIPFSHVLSPPPHAVVNLQENVGIASCVYTLRLAQRTHTPGGDLQELHCPIGKIRAFSSFFMSKTLVFRIILLHFLCLMR